MFIGTISTLNYPNIDAHISSTCLSKFPGPFIKAIRLVIHTTAPYGTSEPQQWFLTQRAPTDYEQPQICNVFSHSKGFINLLQGNSYINININPVKPSKTVYKYK